ncbi:multisubunit potassium/proton antiporter, PhaD subunit [Roseovarius azorensis]|uniref:Multisubunit potassium/proton antiporter, PhaD subunit n=1 Tax=Roseovarius azorensis TaxID=1287727 RepID=A0A1H7FMN1_9RHOB|nr:monovalent cation/H+ antiporter subunit D [Roseovarius azorensis]SEK27363.1 multisubunit potassium/proton antiporter, PhaD subunit [Roseovarius azorensis]
MSHWIIAPVVLPAVLAAILTLSMRHHPALQRVFSLAGSGAVLAIAISLMTHAATGAIEVYELGNWPAPFGIVLVLDRLSALMVLLTAVLAIIILLYAVGTGWDQRGNSFHALFQFQLMGIFGAFLTGDAFNLFVFFEVLLIASYGLMIHAGGRRRFRAGVQYVIYNLLGSTLFLFALGTLYAVTGTLNMADLAQRAAEVPPEDSGLLRVGAMLLFLVFAIKAALLPLHFWLPETYAEAPAPVAALFAIMTKVGAYAILRMYTLVFGPDLATTANLIDQILLYGALLTLAVGMIGILGAKRLGRLAAFAAIASMGTLLIALSGFTVATTSAAIYYLVHSTLAGALLFIVVDLVREQRGEIAGALRPGPQLAQHGLITALFFGAAIATAGMPPLSGFIGKLLILDAVRDMSEVWLVWSVILITSLVAMLGFAQAGSVIFWKTETPEPAPDETEPTHTAPPQPTLPVVACFAMLASLVALSVFAGSAMGYIEATADQLHDPANYISTVLRQR